MPLIRKIQSRDVQSLTDTFPEQASDYFDNLYIEHLQETHTLFVASDKDDDGNRLYYGYVCLSWESGYTQFWRRNIPEITDLFVHKNHRQQGLARQLISACEDIVRSKNYTMVGIRVAQSTDSEWLKSLYERLGYSDEGFNARDEQVCLVKKLV